MSTAFDPKTIIITAVVTIITTVLALDWYGYIRHTSDADGRETGIYRSILLKEGEEYKMSAKEADTMALCVQGYLALEFSGTGMLAGFLVDEKNRGVRCKFAGE